MQQLLDKIKAYSAQIEGAAVHSKEELEAFALSDAKIKELLGGKEIIKVVCVPKRLVNIVVR